MDIKVDEFSPRIDIKYTLLGTVKKIGRLKESKNWDRCENQAERFTSGWKNHWIRLKEFTLWSLSNGPRCVFLLEQMKPHRCEIIVFWNRSDTIHLKFEKEVHTNENWHTSINFHFNFKSHIETLLVISFKWSLPKGRLNSIGPKKTHIESGWKNF